MKTVIAYLFISWESESGGGGGTGECDDDVIFPWSATSLTANCIGSQFSIVSHLYSIGDDCSPLRFP